MSDNVRRNYFLLDVERGIASERFVDGGGEIAAVSPSEKPICKLRRRPFRLIRSIRPRYV